MTQLAASRSAPASSSFGNVADISPVLALSRSLILVSAHIPYEVHRSRSADDVYFYASGHRNTDV